jgi:hypothetical protein
MASTLRRIFGAITGWDRNTWEQKRFLRYRASVLIATPLSFLPIPLRILLKWANSDKELPGHHSYGRTYDRLFRHLKYRPIRLLEIGIGGYESSLGGRSLLAWRAYFPFARIVAFDIEPKPGLAGGRVTIYQADQTSMPDLNRIAAKEGPFDIVIDDGSHLNAHQIFTFHALFPAVRPGGLYIVEDVQTSYWPGRIGGINWDGATVDSPAFDGTACGYFANLTKYLNHAEFIPGQVLDERMLGVAKEIANIQFEHNLIVVTKGENVEASCFSSELAAWAQ